MSLPSAKRTGHCFPGTEDFPKRRVEKVSLPADGKCAGWARRLTRPAMDGFPRAVATACEWPGERILDRPGGLSFKVAVYLLRRAGNLA